MTLEKIKSDFKETKFIFIACKQFVEDIEYLHFWKRKNPQLYFTYAYFFPRMYHAIGFFLVIEITKLFSEHESYSLRTFGKRLSQLHNPLDKYFIFDRAQLDHINNALNDTTLDDLLLKIKTTRDKYFAHIDVNRPDFEEIKVSAHEIKNVLIIAENYILMVSQLLGEPTDSFMNTHSELGHLVFERLNQYEQYREIYGQLPK